MNKKTELSPERRARLVWLLSEELQKINQTSPWMLQVEKEAMLQQLADKEDAIFARPLSFAEAYGSPEQAILSPEQAIEAAIKELRQLELRRQELISSINTIQNAHEHTFHLIGFDSYYLYAKCSCEKKVRYEHGFNTIDEVAFAYDGKVCNKAIVSVPLSAETYGGITDLFK